MSARLLRIDAMVFRTDSVRFEPCTGVPCRRRRRRCATAAGSSTTTSASRWPSFAPGASPAAVRHPSPSPRPRSGAGRRQADLRVRLAGRRLLRRRPLGRRASSAAAFSRRLLGCRSRRRRRLLGAGAGQARLERGHEVEHLGRLLGRGGRHDLLARGLALDEREHLLAVLVVVLLGIELAGERVHQLARHVQLALARLGAPSRSTLAVGREHLVGVAHRLEARASPSTGRMATSASFDRSTNRPDRDLALVLHHLGEQAVGLGRVLVGDEVVRLLEVHRVDVGEVDEVLDLDLAGSPWA